MGDRIKQSCATVWNILTDEWCKQCFLEENKKAFIETIKIKCDAFSK